jgi:hypothetical protein
MKRMRAGTTRSRDRALHRPRWTPRGRRTLGTAGPSPARRSTPARACPAPRPRCGPACPRRWSARSCRPGCSAPRLRRPAGGVVSDCHVAAELKRFVPGCQSYSVGVFESGSRVYAHSNKDAKLDQKLGQLQPLQPYSHRNASVLGHPLSRAPVRRSPRRAWPRCPPSSGPRSSPRRRSTGPCRSDGLWGNTIALFSTMGVSKRLL